MSTYAPGEWLAVRLAREVEQLEQIRCAAIDPQRPATIPFDHVYVTFNIRCIAGLDGNGQPQYRERHNIVIDVPPDWPKTGYIPRMAVGLPPPFHPNFWNHGVHYGLVCVHGGGAVTSDPNETLALLILRIAKMLQYDPLVTQIHDGPNNEAARWYADHRHRADLFPTDRQSLPLLGAPPVSSKPDGDEDFIVGPPR